MNRMIPIKGLSALSAATAFLFGFSFLISRPQASIVPLFIVLAGLESMAIFCALLWALPKSNTVFFSIFVGDSLLGFAGLGLAVYWLESRHIAYTLPLLSLGLAYLLLPLVQIPFFHRAV